MHSSLPKFNLIDYSKKAEVRNLMLCTCGSTHFLPLGIQKHWAEPSLKRYGKELYLINCAECGTTLTCTKDFFDKVKNPGAAKLAYELMETIIKVERSKKPWF